MILGLGSRYKDPKSKGEDYHAGYYKVPEPNPEPPLPPTGNYQRRGLSCWLL